MMNRRFAKCLCLFFIIVCAVNFAAQADEVAQSCDFSFLGEDLVVSVTTDPNLPPSDDAPRIDVVQVEPLDDEWLDHWIVNMHDKDGALNDLVKCLVLLSTIQTMYPGGIEKSALDDCLAFFGSDNAEKTIDEVEDAIQICFSDNVSLSLLPSVEDSNRLTGAIVTVILEDDFTRSNVPYPLKIEFNSTVVKPHV